MCDMSDITRSIVSNSSGSLFFSAVNLLAVTAVANHTGDARNQLAIIGFDVQIGVDIGSFVAQISESIIKDL